jgi:hypothetical protein
MTKLEEELKEARNQAEEADKKYDEVAKKLAQVNTVFTTEPMYSILLSSINPRQCLAPICHLSTLS